MQPLPATADPTGEVRELIAFDVNGQAFCVDLRSVREIRGWTPATPIPRSPPYVCGVVNLRGNMLPIIDLAARLDYGRTVPSDRHAIVVVSVSGQLLGLLVDGVSDILSVQSAEIQQVPTLGTADSHDFVRGILPTGDRMITLLGLDGLVPEAARQAA